MENTTVKISKIIETFTIKKIKINLNHINYEHVHDVLAVFGNLKICLHLSSLQNICDHKKKSFGHFENTQHKSTKIQKKKKN